MRNKMILLKSKLSTTVSALLMGTALLTGCGTTEMESAINIKETVTVESTVIEESTEVESTTVEEFTELGKH